MKIPTYITTGILFYLAISQGVQAASLTFDYNGSDPTAPPGTGTWDLSTPNWFNGATYVNWSNSLSDTAVVSGGNSANVTTNVNVGTISTSGGTNSLALSSGVVMTLGAVGGSSISITNGSVTTTGGTLALSGSTTFFNNSGLNIGSAINLSTYTLTNSGNTNGNVTIGGVVYGTGGLTKSNGGFLTLAGANTFTGDVSVTAGPLRAGVASVANVSGAFGLNTNVILSGTGSLSLQNGVGPWYNTQIGSLTGGATNGVSLARAVLTTGGNNTDSTYAGVMTSSGTGNGLTKIGSGTFTLTGASTYNGVTTVSGGTLLASNTTGSATGTGTVSVSTTLGGTGRIAPTLANGISVASGGHLAPGASASIESLEFDLANTTGIVTMVSGSDFHMQLGTANAVIATITLNSSDLLIISGASVNDVVFNSNNVDFLGTGQVGFYKLFDSSLAAATVATDTWGGDLVYDGTTGVVSSGLIATNLAGSLTGTFIMGGLSSGGDAGDIYFSVVPEPSTAAMFMGGFGILFGFRRRPISL